MRTAVSRAWPASRAGPQVSKRWVSRDVYSRGSAGLALSEILLAIALLLLVTAAVFALLAPTEGGFAAQLESADMEQRLRVAADTLSQDLDMAGAGADAGRWQGPLSAWLPAVLPFRRGALR